MGVYDKDQSRPREVLIVTALQMCDLGTAWRTLKDITEDDFLDLIAFVLKSVAATLDKLHKRQILHLDCMSDPGSLSCQKDFFETGFTLI